MYDLKHCELQVILDAVKLNKCGAKKVLRKRVLGLLSASSLKTRFLRQKIVQVYKARLEQNHQPHQQHQPPPPPPLIIQHPHESRFLPQFFLQTPSYNLPYTNNTLPHFNEAPPASSAEFENLPFFKTMQTLLTPTECQTISDAANLSGLFFLTDDVRHLIVKSWNISRQEYKIQIILRLVRRGPKVNFSERLPYNINVSVNDRPCKLPTMNIPTKAGITPWRCNVPIDITQQTDLRNCSQHELKITWTEDSQTFNAAVYVAQKLTWTELLMELKKRPLRASDKTKELIKKSMESDADMGVDSMFATVKDPLSKMRMELPARGVNCIHMQCFDAIQFLQMNEQKQTWICPLCKKKVRYEDIEVDEFFLNILHSPNLSEECENVILLADGTWSEKKPKDFTNTPRINDNRSSKHIEVFTLSDSDDDNEVLLAAKRRKCNPPKVEESIIKSEHILQTEDLTTTNDNNSAEDNYVLDLSLKNNSSPSTSTKYEPIITLTDDSDSQSLPESSNILNSFYLPNITISNNGNESKPSSSDNSKSNEHQEIDKSRAVLCVITLD